MRNRDTLDQFVRSFKNIFAFILILNTAFHCVRRNLACYHFVQCCTKRIDIGMRSLVATASVLFFRRISRFNNYCKASAVRCSGKSGCTKIYQFQFSLCCNENIVRGNISVDNANRMNSLKRFHNRHQKLNGSILGNIPFFPQILGQSHTFQKFHYEIGCSVFFKAVKNPDNTVLILKFCQFFSFFKKFRHTVIKLLCLFSAQNTYLILSRNPCRKLVWHIFFNCNFLFQFPIPCQIGCTKSSRTKNLSNNVPVMEKCSGHNSNRFICRSTDNIPAMRTYIIFIRN